MAVHPVSHNPQLEQHGPSHPVHSLNNKGKGKGGGGIFIVMANSLHALSTLSVAHKKQDPHFYVPIPRLVLQVNCKICYYIYLMLVKK